jgi:hypothetical protein
MRVVIPISTTANRRDHFAATKHQSRPHPSA